MSGRGIDLGAWLACVVVTLGSAAQLSAGSISGRVSDAVSGAPLAGVEVSVTQSTATGVTDEAGEYVIEGLQAGSYVVLVSPPPAGYVGEIFADVPCFNPPRISTCPVDRGTEVAVPAEGAAENVDFALAREAVIEGQVVAEDGGEPLTNAIVSLIWEPEPLFGPVTAARVGTAEDGSYRVTGLPATTFYAIAQAPEHLFELFDDLPFDPNDDDPTAGTPIVTQAGATRSGVDFDLLEESVISGRVVVDGSGEPIAAAGVWLHDEDGVFLTGITTDGMGAYRFDGVEAGTYYVRTFVAREWADEVWNDVFCPQADGVCDVTRGDAITVAPGDSVGGVDFELATGGRISGTVLNSAGEPVAGQVAAYGADGQAVRFALLDDQGGYTLSGLAPATYTVATRFVPGYRSQLYDGLPCGDQPEPDCDVTQGAPIEVELDQAVEGVDFVLERATNCAPSGTRLCLNGGRFAVEARWRTRTGESGAAQAVDLGRDDSGSFTFFGTENLELLVKVLDACNTSFDSYWVFAAGLTNVEVELTVTDTATNRVQRYTNPLGTPFQPIQDTRAFATCP